MSSRPDPQRMHEAFRAGGTFFMVKPLDHGRLTRFFRSTRGIMLQERRRYWRIPLTVPSHCAVGSRRLPQCSIRNLSATGTLLRGDGSLHPGTSIYLAFPLSKTDRSMVSAWGTVVRTDDGGHAGVRFTRLSRSDRRRILERIAAESDTA
jgi:c-di-GMP-binding flagellar brake protein YcgR